MLVGGCLYGIKMALQDDLLAMGTMIGHYELPLGDQKEKRGGKSRSSGYLLQFYSSPPLDVCTELLPLPHRLLESIYARLFNDLNRSE
jgi:hypothetical protein